MNITQFLSRANPADNPGFDIVLTEDDFVAGKSLLLYSRLIGGAPEQPYIFKMIPFADWSRAEGVTRWFQLDPECKVCCDNININSDIS
jgi:hypothetical protein